MIDIIVAADLLFDVHAVVDGSEDVFLRDVLRNELMDVLDDRDTKCTLIVGVLLHQTRELRIVNELLRYILIDDGLLLLYRECIPELLLCVLAEEAVGAVCLAPEVLAYVIVLTCLLVIDLLCIEAYILRKVDLHRRKYLLLTGRSLDPYERNSGILDLDRLRKADLITGLCDHLTGRCIDDVLCQCVTLDSVLKMKLLIKLITSNLRKVIAARVEEHTVQKRACRINGQRLARSDLTIELEKTTLVVLCLRLLLLEGSEKLRLLTEELDDLLIGAYTHRSDKCRYRNLTGSIHTYPVNIIGIGLILDPCATVRNHGAAVELLTNLIMVYAIINARRTNEL